MSKFNKIKSCESYYLRRYCSSKRGFIFYMTEVNLKKSHFEIFHCTERGYCSYLRLNHNPKKVLNRLGYSLDDFLLYENVEEFLEIIAKHLNEFGNNINASCSRYFVDSFGLELL